MEMNKIGPRGTSPAPALDPPLVPIFISENYFQEKTTILDADTKIVPRNLT